MTQSLFDETGTGETKEHLAQNAVILYGFAHSLCVDLIAELGQIVAAAPFRHMSVRGGHKMSVAMTNCGALGWVSDENGYRYDPIDPLSGDNWPGMPVPFEQLAIAAAAEAGFESFVPDACLINRYEPGAQMGLHQDKNEIDYSAPIVSISLGLPAMFLFGGLKRSDPTRKIRVENGDVIVWGGKTRLAYHGLAKLKGGEHPLTGASRINLTFRKAG